MANTTTKNKTKTNKDKTEAEVNTDVLKTDSQPTKTEIPEPKQSFVVKDIDPGQYVVVKNGFQGKLVYKSSRTGESFEWPEFGSEQEMELRELRNAKGAHKKYFVNNWFMFDEEWIVDYLGVKQFYKHAISIDNFDDIFTKSPEEIKAIISEVSDGQKKSIAYRAKVLIASYDIDSNKVINALEEALGVELVER